MSPSRRRRYAHRGERVDEVMRQVIADALAGMSDPRLELVSVTGVEASSDAAFADVFVQVIGNDAKRDKAMSALNSARGVLQARINAEMHLKHTPILRFQYDASYDKGRRIDELLGTHQPLIEEPSEGGEGAA